VARGVVLQCGMIGGSIVASHADGLDKLARQARVVLIVLAAIQFVIVGILCMAGVPDGVRLRTTVAIGLTFAGLAVWARKEPLPAVLLGLGLYVMGVVAVAIVEPASLTSGLVGKAVVAALFYNGVDTALAFEKMRREQAATKSR
jgi:hypothetical protein